MINFKVFEKAKLKDKVYSLIHGIGEVIKVENNLIDVFFEDGASIIVDFDGNEFPNQKHPSIYWKDCATYKSYRLKDLVEQFLIKKPYLKCEKPIYLYYGEYPGGGYSDKWQISEFAGKKFTLHFELTDDVEKFVKLLNDESINEVTLVKAFIELEWI